MLEAGQRQAGGLGADLGQGRARAGGQRGHRRLRPPGYGERKLLCCGLVPVIYQLLQVYKPNSFPLVLAETAGRAGCPAQRLVPVAGRLGANRRFPIHATTRLATPAIQPSSHVSHKQLAHLAQRRAQRPPLTILSPVLPPPPPPPAPATPPSAPAPALTSRSMTRVSPSCNPRPTATRLKPCCLRYCRSRSSAAAASVLKSPVSLGGARGVRRGGAGNPLAAGEQYLARRSCPLHASPLPCPRPPCPTRCSLDGDGDVLQRPAPHQGRRHVEGGGEGELAARVVALQHGGEVGGGDLRRVPAVAGTCAQTATR